MKSQSGQSTIEFALTMIILMGFFAFFFQFSYMSAFANFVQYATFMAGRAYQAAGPDEQDQVERAKAVLTRTLKQPNRPGTDRFAKIAKGVEEGDEIKGALIGRVSGPNGYIAGDSTKNWMEGVRYTFRSRLLGTQGGSGSGVNSVTLRSEAFLGREPTFEECKDSMRANTLSGVVVIDNGC